MNGQQQMVDKNLFVGLLAFGRQLKILRSNTKVFYVLYIQSQCAYFLFKYQPKMILHLSKKWTNASYAPTESWGVQIVKVAKLYFFSNSNMAF